jgi:hypothetical protein
MVAAMTDPDQNGSSPMDETQPIIRRRTRIPAFLRWIIVGLAALSFLVVIVALAIPSLAKPPADLNDPYEVFSLGDSSEILDPDSDHLVLNADERVAVYIPQGAQLGFGQFLILERRADFIPGRIEGDVERLHAVDLLIVRPDGELVGSVNFDTSLLLCFQLEGSERQEADQGAATFSIQRYEETAENAAWHTLESAPGWQEGQVCSALTHLSLYALVRQNSATETPSVTPTVEQAQPKGDIFDLYGIPTPSPTP